MERSTSFLQILEGMRERNDNEGALVWKDKGKKVFTIKGANAFFSNEVHHSHWPWKQISKAKAPSKVNCFSQLVARKACLTHEKTSEKEYAAGVHKLPLQCNSKR